MTKRPVKNVAASVRQKLLNKSRADIRPFHELVQYYAIEPDGLIYFAEQIEIETIAEEAEYQGVRIWFPAKIETMSLNMRWV